MSTEKVDPSARGLDKLLQVVAALRAADGCPWDREQTLETLRECLIEESYEVIDAISDDDPGRHREELGDVLLQVAMQARIREEAGEFSFADIAEATADKLIRRHPHVFGDLAVADTQAVLKNWERIKSEEKREREGSLFDGVPRHLPALRRAQRVQSRASRVGFDWDDIADVWAKVDEELAELRAADAGEAPERVEEEFGDLLFAVVNLCRFRGITAEDALEKTVGKFVRRFAAVEERVRAEGREMTDCSLQELDAHWNAVKEEE